MDVNDIVRIKIAEAARRIELAKKRRAEMEAARARGLGFRHAAKLRAQAARRPEPPGVATPEPEETVMATTDPAQFVLTTSHGEEDRHRLLAFHRTFGAAMEAYEIRYHQARHHEEQPEVTAREEALYAAIAAVGRSYAATALNQVVHAFASSLDEATAQALGDIAATLDLAVVEDLTGANAPTV